LLLFVVPSMPMAGWFLCPFEKTVPHVRHISITVVSSGLSCSSPDACGHPLCADDPRTGESETMWVPTRVHLGAKTAWHSEVEQVLRERTLRPNSYPVLNGLSA